MKAKLVPFLLFLLLGATACVKENLDDCPDEEATRLVLQFKYDDLTGKDVFDQRIEVIDVALFDASYILQFHDSYQRSALTERSVGYDLEAGTYYVVCWGNITSTRNELPSVETTRAIHIDDLNIHHRSADGADPLHYAPDYRAFVRAKGETRSGAGYDIYRIDVLPGQTTYATRAFMCAYRTINIYVSGVSGLEDEGVALPVSGIRNMPGSYNYFLLADTENSLDIEKNTRPATVNDVKYAYAGFYVPHFGAINDLEIYVAGGSGTSTYSQRIRLEDFLSEHDIEVFDGDEKVINICFNYVNDIFVGIENPGWKDQNITIPGFGDDDDE